MKPGIWLSVASLFLLLPARGAAREADDRVVFAREVVIESGQKLHDIVCYFCMIRVRGTLTGDAVAIGGGVEVTGTIEGDAVIVGGGVKLGEGARIGGELVVIGGQVERGPLSEIAGGVEHNRWMLLPGQRQFYLRGDLANLGVTILVVVFVYLVFRRRRIEAMAESVRKRYVLAPLVGVAITLLTSLLFNLVNRLGELRRLEDVLNSTLGILFVSVLGVGATAASCAIGGRLAPGRGALARTLLGAAVINLTNAIPIVGFVVFSLFSLAAMGGALLSGFGQAADWLPKRFARRPAVSPAEPS